MKKPVVLLVLMFLLSTVIYAGCGQQSEKSAPETAPAEKTITDMAGKTVKIPGTINRVVITCCGGATQQVAAWGAADKIVAQPTYCVVRFKTLLKMYPAFKDTPEVGSFDNVNVEELLKLEPDIVIASKGSEKGNSKIAETGIPVVAISTGLADIESLKNEFKMLGVVFNNEDKADKLVSFWDSRLKLINDRVDKIPQENRKKVYYVLGNLLHTNGSASWGQHLITAAGGINVAEELGEMKDINVEQILKWNPEVMIISSNEGKFVSIEEVKNNPQLKDITAVRDNQLYLCPMGTFWWDRPAPEAIMGIMWLAKTLYPDEFTDIDLVKESKEFYQQFYDYSLSDQEFNEFLKPQS